MSARRLRMVAGPNGSGKSTLFSFLERETKFPLGHCLNPDALQRSLTETSQMRFSDWGLQVEECALRAFISAHALAPKLARADVRVTDNVLYATEESAGGYFIAVLSDFMRRCWMNIGQSFTCETVMSSRDKIDLLREASNGGYRTYLYFICTDSITINRERVANRVSQGGHNVPSDKIGARYERCLSLLPEAIRSTNRAYLFDNSRNRHELIAEFEATRLVSISPDLPGWFVRSVLSQPDLLGAN